MTPGGVLTSCRQLGHRFAIVRKAMQYVGLKNLNSSNYVSPIHILSRGIKDDQGVPTIFYPQGPWPLGKCRKHRGNCTPHIVCAKPVMEERKGIILAENHMEHRLKLGKKLPSGKLTVCYWKSPCLTGKSTNSMAIFNSYVKLPEGNDFMEKHWEKVDGNILRIQWIFCWMYVGCAWKWG